MYIPADNTTSVSQVLPPSQRKRSPSCFGHSELHKTPGIAQATDLYQLTQELDSDRTSFSHFCALLLRDSSSGMWHSAGATYRL